MKEHRLSQKDFENILSFMNSDLLVKLEVGSHFNKVDYGAGWYWVDSALKTFIGRLSEPLVAIIEKRIDGGFILNVGTFSNTKLPLYVVCDCDELILPEEESEGDSEENTSEDENKE